MHAPKPTFRPLFLLVFALLTLLTAGCGGKNSDDPAPQSDNAFVGSYQGKLVTTDGVDGKQASFATTIEPLTIKIKAGKSATEVGVDMVYQTGNLNETWTGTTSGTIVTLAKQNGTGGAVYEGTGSLTGKDLRLVIRETNANNAYVYQHTLTGTKQ